MNDDMVALPLSFINGTTTAQRRNTARAVVSK